MFGIFDSPQRKMRESAKNWLEVADRVWCNRRDRLAPEETEALTSGRDALRALVSAKTDAAKLRPAIESLEGVLRRVGGTVYPKTSLADNVEFFLMAAIVILGVRTYVIQPFKIPTNSMWPTYYGMTAENFPPDAPAPGPVGQAFRFLAFGAQRRTLVAPADGEVAVPLFIRGDSVNVAYTIKPGRSWFIFPARMKEYTFMVGGAEASVQVPEDFSEFDDIFLKTFFTDKAALLARIREARAAGQTQPVRLILDPSRRDVYEAERIPLGRTVRKGDPVVRFDIMAGDQLLVDRVSFQFVRPKVGEGFVFRTDHIPDIVRTFGSQYFVKRLVGVPGDTIEVQDPMILRNGAPITGAAAFDKNARMESPYRGYANASHDDPRYSILFPGEAITVPQRSYLAMGDNSHNSFDGRYWGYVPQEDVIGRPLAIYFPFTRRWGPAK